MNINKISDIVQFQIKNIFGLEKKEEIELNIIVLRWSNQSI